jgi:hypothetical protein
VVKVEVGGGRERWIDDERYINSYFTYLVILVYEGV